MPKSTWYIPAILWAILIIILSGFPGNKVPELPIWQFDKFIHTVMYAVFSILLLLPYLQLKKQPLTYFIIILIGVFLGGIMEIFQNNIFINRSGNWYDFFANCLGTVLGIVLFPFVIKLLPINKLIYKNHF